MGCGGSSVVVPKVSEIILEASDGIKMAAQSWEASTTSSTGVGGSRQENNTNSNNNNNNDDDNEESLQELRCLMLHGWMDNCRSFYWLAPALIESLDSSMVDTTTTTTSQEASQHGSSNNNKRYKHVHVVALDLPGHGLSSHRREDAPPMIRSEYLFYIAEAIRQLKWWNPMRGGGPPRNPNQSQRQPSPPKIVLIGHSMSAGLSLMYAAAFPEQIQQLIMLDSLGHLSRPINTTSNNLRQYVQSRQLDGPIIAKVENRFYYPSMESVVKARVRSPTMFPGNQYISEEAAKELCQRGVIADEVETKPAPATTLGPKKSSSVKKTKKYRFRHDQRLMWNSIQYYTEDQLEALYNDIQCPTCILLGQDGWPINEERKRQVEKNLLQTTLLHHQEPPPEGSSSSSSQSSRLVLKTLPGSHHFHMDPKTADAVVEEIIDFLLPATATTTSSSSLPPIPPPRPPPPPRR